ncbi:collagen alpha-1(V) chain-like [Solea solea]|uniref:collagen alpha-1(V) chain-like n=1 Tax=Solea solea TaxID=90069 RepID=UPI00272A0E44|nr:collagen alpha-1(V) chain-like [Solea solea]
MWCLPADMMQSSSSLSMLWLRICLCLLSPNISSLQGVNTPQQPHLHPKVKHHGRTRGDMSSAGVKEVDLLQLLDMQSVAHYNVSAAEDDRGCPAYEIGQYSTLAQPTAAVFGHRFPDELSVLVRLRLDPRRSEQMTLLAVLGQEGEELFQLTLGPRLFTVITVWGQHYEFPAASLWDGSWHSLSLAFSLYTLKLYLDCGLQESASWRHGLGPRINTLGLVLLGGASLPDHTPFTGTIQKIAFVLGDPTAAEQHCQHYSSTCSTPTDKQVGADEVNTHPVVVSDTTLQVLLTQPTPRLNPVSSISPLKSQTAPNTEDVHSTDAVKTHTGMETQTTDLPNSEEDEPNAVTKEIVQQSAAKGPQPLSVSTNEQLSESDTDISGTMKVPQTTEESITVRIALVHTLQTIQHPEQVHQPPNAAKEGSTNNDTSVLESVETAVSSPNIGPENPTAPSVTPETTRRDAETQSADGFVSNRTCCFVLWTNNGGKTGHIPSNKYIAKVRGH